MIDMIDMILACFRIDSKMGFLNAQKGFKKKYDFTKKQHTFFFALGSSLCNNNVMIFWNNDVE